MKKKILAVVMVFTTVLLLSSCKSEEEKNLDEVCSRDMSVRDNEDACSGALFISCGGFLGLMGVEKCAEHPNDNVCSGIPSYCITNYSKAFLSKK